MPCTFNHCSYKAPAKPRAGGPIHDPNGPVHKRLSDHIRDRHRAIKYEYKRNDTTFTFERKQGDLHRYVCVCGTPHQTLKGLKKHVQGESTSGRRQCFRVLRMSGMPQSTNNDKYVLQIKKLRAQVKAITESLKEVLAQQQSNSRKPL
ncbi:hypothetical protein BGZ58_011105 [Dissophora ornata]|nr:hypothetical protein BGZ58_011105 [Dissophora ornata]